VNLIGEHTDYAGGLCLPFAIERGVEVSAWPREDRTVEVEALALDEADSFGLNRVAAAAGWRAYVRGTAAELDRAVGLPAGARLVIDADLPMGGGLGSSAALCVAVWLALAAAAGARPPGDPWEVARALARAESAWADAQTGMLDQLASLLGRPDRAVLLDFGADRFERVPLELGDWRLAVIPSGAVRSNAESRFNQRRSEWEAARKALDARKPLSGVLRRRAGHVRSENARVRDAAQALRRGDIAALGPLLDASHASLRDECEVSVPAVEATVERAKRAGAVGARIHGGGFGGGVLALFPPTSEPPADALTVTPSEGARVL
jgi:galactokinase